MKIHNVRAGFATNSSSSHSIVMVPRGQHVHTDEYDRYNYGWEQFTLADPESKAAYFIAQMYQAMNSCQLSEHEIYHTIRTLLGVDVTDLPTETGVDHQSTWYGLDQTIKNYPELVKQMFVFVQRDDVVILGGNDNSDQQEPPANSWEDPRVHIFGQLGAGKLKQDGANWIMFNDRSGTKMRFTLDPDAAPYEKSTVPELVDLKITNWCSYGCSFCYQSSTKQGQHAELKHVKKVLKALGEMEVFEVAIGGGEPTHYPYLIQVLEEARAHGIVPNFTTFGVDWLKNEQLVKKVQECVGAIGVSVHSVSDLNKVSKINDVINTTQNVFTKRHVKVTAQHVVGSQDIGELAQILETCWDNGVDLLLLGYKQVGFGKTQECHDMTGLDVLLKLRQDRKLHWRARMSMLGVDTAFVQQFQPLLDELKIPNVLVTSEEGKFSMYADCVTMTQGPSSYMPDFMEPIDTTDILGSIQRAYAKW